MYPAYRPLPPIAVSFSTTIAVPPLRTTLVAAVKPAIPAPMTSKSASQNMFHAPFRGWIEHCASSQ